MARNKIFLNETLPPKGSFERHVGEFWEMLEGGPLLGTNIGQQFGLEKGEPYELLKSISDSTNIQRRRIRMRLQGQVGKKRR